MERKRASILTLLLLIGPARVLAREAVSPDPTPALPASREIGPALTLGWQPSMGGRRSLSAVALDPTTGRVALGDERGAILVAPGGHGVETVARPDVSSLAFTAEGMLLIGTHHGLFLRDASGDLLDRSPSPGDEARDIARVSTCPGVIAAATLAGVYVSRDAIRWQPVPGPLARAAAAAVSLRCLGDGADLRAVAGGDVWRSELRSGAQGLVADAAVPVDGLEATVRSRAVDVLLDGDAAELVLAPDLLAVRAGDGSDWKVRRLALAPGASFIRVASALGRRWIATDRGLYAETSADAWTRLPVDGALTVVRDVTGDGDHVLAATDEGLLEGAGPSPGLETARGEDRRLALAALEATGPPDPAVEEVFQAALAYLALRPEQIRNLQRGLSARGLFPQLELRFQRGRSRDSDADYDEAFVSGDLRRLRDEHAGRSHEVSASLYMTWELGDLAFSPDAIDLSKESRAVIQLRDDVLDEITHLYFERRRVLLELAGLDQGQHGQDAARLRLRADELAAGLDAWTGGWFGRRVPTFAR